MQWALQYIALHCTLQVHYTALNCILNSFLHSIAFYTALHCTVLHVAALHCSTDGRQHQRRQRCGQDGERGRGGRGGDAGGRQGDRLQVYSTEH